MSRNTRISIIGILIIFVVFFFIGRYSGQPAAQPEQKPMTHADSLWYAQYDEYEKEITTDTACVRKGCNIPTLGGFIDWREHKAKEAALKSR